MPNEHVIHVENLTKTYRLYAKPADRVKETFHPLRKQYHHPFHALEDVSFNVRRGETFGIIGRNGSGKSTLLQLICGILQPTSGVLRVKGKISALLELGAGFNPEFTGHQNVYLNASILGLTTEQIDACLDDILAFADIGDFINQPVKSYSSGMYVRLAFAVAININPDILVVDEALSVGDEAFQRKCFAQIDKIKDGGGTILFVSHGAGLIIELCNRALLLDQGELLLSGIPKKVVSLYHKMIFASPDKVESLKAEWRADPDRFNLIEDIIDEDANACVEKAVIENTTETKPDICAESFYNPGMKSQSKVCYERKGAEIENPCLTTPEGEPVNILVGGKIYHYRYTVFFESPAFMVRFGMLIKTVTGVEISGCASHPEGDGLEFIEGRTRWEIRFPFRCRLNPGPYFLNAGVLGTVNGCEEYLDRNIDVAMFRVDVKKNACSTAVVDMVGEPDIAMI